MPEKRMFSLKVTDTDKFLDMPTSTQALYFHLGMHGDDDGFVASPKRITKTVGCNEDDLKLLAVKGFIIPFDSGVIVITDWLVNNTLKNDRYHPTIYQAEKALLEISCAKKYVLDSKLGPGDIQGGSDMAPEQLQIGTMPEPERNLTKQSKERAAKSPSAPPVRPTLEEVRAYCEQRQNGIDPEYFFDFYAANGWVQGRGKPIKDWKAAVRTWEKSKSKKCESRREDDIYGSAI